YHWAVVHEEDAMKPGTFRGRAAHAIAVTIVAAPIVVSAPAHAWGPEGHVIVAIMAEDLLTPAARQAVRDMLSGAPLATSAIFADEYRVTHPETSRWHYVDIPFDATAYDEVRDCEALVTGDCVIKAIEREERIIPDHDAAFFDRADALKRLVHFVGDLH